MGFLNLARSLFVGKQSPASRERRKLKRVACHQAFQATRGEQSFELTVVDVGFGGFRAQCEVSPGSRGDLLHLRRVATDFRRHLTGAYTTGLMVRVAWVKKTETGYEAGLHVPQIPGSMRISWFREMLGEMGFDEQTLFSKRVARRHRCRLPGELNLVGAPKLEGMLLDLSVGGGLFGTLTAAAMGQEGEMLVKWGSRSLLLPVTVVGVRAGASSADPKWLHSVKFNGSLKAAQERELSAWLEEFSRNE